ncbi:L-aspartate oxidase [Rhodohalobacter sp. SW132]|uniref:L-aspartate oxidase n=1 Tax=Rhodohalobacter sp. SW132 TaxID=2293433 RepID=UPI000E261677|nr:L-aspartate oxidase [Rhodohalobacter sp. SW132]REL24783.1 L-aspartate oxidase [Rhodohalobacter sp. SW132]
MLKTDFLVIGSGIAGLSFAVKAALAFPEQSLTIVTKDSLIESNTRYAQGGIAVVTDFLNDDFEKHTQDTLVAGDGLCDEEIVKIVVEEGPDRLREIVDMGVQFDKNPDGEYRLGVEGAHSAKRILHHQDMTGYEIQSSLVKKIRSLDNVQILEHHFAVDLITQHHFGEKVTRSRKDTRCFGAYIMDLKSNRVEKVSAGATVLASGGAGQVYDLTTNPPVATGDGVAMAYRAKAEVQQMQFIQFHPTALYGSKGARAFLISEAVRGFGAILKTADEKPFMKKYDERGSLASRDIVARAIDTEMKARGKEHVYLDCRDLDIEAFKTHFPTIYETCLEYGIDVARDMIPVAPAAHYMCGGVKADEWGRSSIDRLYCCGEVAQTGLHGANRLASNSLLEALVFADRCFRDLQKKSGELEVRDAIPDWKTEGTTEPKEWVLINHNRKEVKRLMNNYIGIVRSDERLRRAEKRLRVIHEETEQLYKTTTLSPQLGELRNMINVSWLIIRQSKEQKENRGTFYNIDLA